MEISYNWLKSYLNIDIEVNKLAEIITSIGLEVGSVDEILQVKGGLEGLVVGEVLTCEKHPDADKLSLTTVNVGGEASLSVVCGAPNVAAGQKVIVATVGTVLYSGEESFTIKKSKIRGSLSEGMLCAEDEIGLGTSHDGIMVLDANAIVGTPAKKYFNLESDFCLEVDITPNRIDAASHIGVARDLAAYLNQNGSNVACIWPDVAEFAIENRNFTPEVVVENLESAPRYSGVTISDIEVKESPEWLKTRLKAVGLNPINNVVDVTNFVLLECGQPLHAFDGDKIVGNKVIVKNLAEGTPFTTLDGVERKLSDKDLMICNAHEGMCIGGVFGGLESGVSATTTKIFLESAHFNPISIRKTGKRHNLNTDASFRFERGTDPNLTIYALKRAALLILEVAGGNISSDIIDIYPTPVLPAQVTLTFTNLNRLIGKVISPDDVRSILKNLDINIISEKNDELLLEIPTYRVDVKREVDVIEDILRIYGYNNVEFSDKLNSTIVYAQKPDQHKLRNLIGDMLAASGYNEIMNNSLTKIGYYANSESFKSENLVVLFNPLSADLGGMRQTLLFGGLEVISRNINRKRNDLKLFELGNCYHKAEQINQDDKLKAYSESQHLSLFVTGQKSKSNWNSSSEESTFFDLKGMVNTVLKRVGVSQGLYTVAENDSDCFEYGLNYVTRKGEIIAQLGAVSPKYCREFDIEKPLFYADINWDLVIKYIANHSIRFTELPKYPEVKRDLALLLDKSVKFSDIETLAFATERKLLKQVTLFDVYTGKNIDSDKKSYAVSFILQDESGTLKENQIERIMARLLETFEQKLNAKLR